MKKDKCVIDFTIKCIQNNLVMRKLFFVYLVVSSAWGSPTQLFSQTERRIELLDFISNKSVDVTIKEDGASRNFILTNLAHTFDSIKVDNAQEIDTMYIALKRFLIINYRSNGGSGEHLRYTKLYTIKGGALIENLSLLTRHDSFSSDGVLQSGYKVTFLINKIKNKYSISLKEKIRAPKSVFSKSIKLSLDNSLMIFYSSVIERGASICINYKFIKSNNNIYRIDLENESYTYYKKKWYQQDRQGCFYKM